MLLVITVKTNVSDEQYDIAFSTNINYRVRLFKLLKMSRDYLFTSIL